MFERLVTALQPLKRDRRGVTIMEYALLAGLIGVALATTMTTLKDDISTFLTNIGTSL